MVTVDDLILQFLLLVDTSALRILALGGDLHRFVVITFDLLVLMIDEALALFDEGTSALVTWLHR